MNSIQDFTGYTPTWCSGCGNWGIGRGVMNALVQGGYSPESLAIVFDIGCSGNMNDFLNAYSVHGLHGRSIPVAIGIKLANHNLPVLVIGGDGSIYGEGGNHFLHACRGNHDITVVVHDNSVYGLTTGQVSPAAHKGAKGKSTPMGVIEQQISPLALALTQGATFVAQTFAGNLPHLTETIKAGMAHKGFSLINVLQPCVTFNKVNTYGYYLQKSYPLKEHDSTDFSNALNLAMQPVIEEKFPLGVFYEVKKPSFHEQLSQLDKSTLVDKINDFQHSHEKANQYLSYFR